MGEEVIAERLQMALEGFETSVDYVKSEIEGTAGVIEAFLQGSTSSDSPTVIAGMQTVKASVRDLESDIKQAVEALERLMRRLEEERQQEEEESENYYGF